MDRETLQLLDFLAKYYGKSRGRIVDEGVLRLAAEGAAENRKLRQRGAPSMRRGQ
jgi:hypothetical protein